MTMITLNHKMAEVIHSNYLLIPVISRFGIHLGFGEKTVQVICDEADIDAEFFVTILNTFSNERYFPEKRLQTFNILIFIKYLQRTHDYYLKSQIPLIEGLIDTLIDKNETPDKNIKLVHDFFLIYKTELDEHIQREELITFPYIENIYHLLYNTFDLEKYKETTQSYSIKRFSEEHDNIDEKLFDLQNLFIKYIPGLYNHNIIHSIVFELFRLERDIRDHTRLEEKVMKPMVLEIENTLKSYMK
jgi:regulator of cell morphogenesis and NO signaling